MSAKVQRSDCSKCVNQVICAFSQANAELGRTISEFVDKNQDCPWIGQILIICQYANNGQQQNNLQSQRPSQVAPFLAKPSELLGATQEGVNVQ